MKVLVTGASGNLGSYLVRELATRGHSITAWSGSSSAAVASVPVQPVDLSVAQNVERAFDQLRPEVVLHAAAVARIDRAVREPGHAMAINRDGTALLARLAGQSGARLLFVSTDMVFDGEGAPYGEEATPGPLSVYGRSKLAGETSVLSLPAGLGLVVRISLLFGRDLEGRTGFFDGLVKSLLEQSPVRLFKDEWRTPLSLLSAARALVDLADGSVAIAAQPALIHLGGPERLSRLEMGIRLAAHLRVDAKTIVGSCRQEAKSEEPRPRDLSLDSSCWRGLAGGKAMPPYEASLEEMGITPFAGGRRC